MADQAGMDGDISVESSQPSTSTQSKKLFKNECITHVEPIVLQQRWTVNNFPTMMKLSRPGMCLRSNLFRDSAGSESCWQLCLYPGGKREENANNVSLFLKMSATSPMKEVLVKAEYRFYFLDDNDVARFSNVNIGDFHAKPPKGGHSWGLRNIPKQKVQNCVRSDGSLVISCAIELMPDVSRVMCKRVSPSSNSATVEIMKSHSDAELRMLLDERNTDVVVEVGPEKQQFRAHKYKLMAHSPVFTAMFAHDTKEAVEGIIRIHEASVVAMKCMLDYMYVGTLRQKDLSTADVAEVIELAEKYHLNDLKQLCEQKLITSTNRDNVSEHASLADFHNAAYLLDHCINVMALNRPLVLASESWACLKKNNPKLAAHILEKMFSVNESNPPPVKRSRV